MAEVKKEWSSILVGKCNEPKLNEDGTPWLIPFGIPKEQYEEMGTLINERGWVNGALRHTKAGNWVMQINKPEPLKENASQEADGLPF